MSEANASVKRRVTKLRGLEEEKEEIEGGGKEDEGEEGEGEERDEGGGERTKDRERENGRTNE